MDNINIVIGLIQAFAALIMIVVTIVYIVITNKILKVTKYQTLKSIQQNLNSSRLSLLKIKLDYLNMDETTEVSEARVLVESEINSIDMQLKELDEKIAMLNKKDFERSVRPSDESVLNNTRGSGAMHL